MASNYIKAKGKIRWAKVYDPDTYGTGATAAVRFMCDFIPLDDTEKAKIVDSGSRLEFNVDKTEGFERIRPRRDLKKEINGTVYQFSPPIISGLVDVKYVNENDEIVRSVPVGETLPRREGTPVTIWNDSIAEITLCVYDTSFGKGTRLEEIHVIELAEEPKREEPSVKVPVDDGDELPF